MKEEQNPNILDYGFKSVLTSKDYGTSSELVLKENSGEIYKKEKAN